MNKSRTDDQMPLYRGFVLRLSAKTAGQSEQAYSQLVQPPSPTEQAREAAPAVHLMVKCKTVRYKLMTFIFRKGAQLYMKKLVDGKGTPAAAKRYEENVSHYFQQWSSDEAEQAELVRKYSRFVMAWPHWLQMRVDAGELTPREFVAGQSYLRLAKEYEDWFAQQSAVEAAPFRGVIFVTYPTMDVPTDPSALHRVLQERFGMRASVVSSIKELSRGNMLAMVSGAVLIPVAIAERTPPHNLATIFTGYGTDVCWMSAAAPEPSVVDPASVKKGELKRFFSVAPRWCKMLASIVKPECRFVDAATEVLVSQAKPPFAELELLAQFRPAAEQEEAFAAAAAALKPDRPLLERARNTCVVYPSIPGTAKTSLLVADGFKLLQAKIGSLERKNDLVIIHGDAAEEKNHFWRRLDERIAARNPYVEDGGCDCIFICDKNCPPGLPTEAPGTDGLHRQIAMSKQEGTALIFVVPESPGLAADGGGSGDGPGTWPAAAGAAGFACGFCLEMLAVCVDRVFRRTEHQNLKGPNSPMTVMMFHNLYNNVTNERFISRQRWLGEVIELPFLRPQAAPDRPAMPAEFASFLMQGKDLDNRKQVVMSKGGRGKGKGKGPKIPPELQDVRNPTKCLLFTLPASQRWSCIAAGDQRVGRDGAGAAGEIPRLPRCGAGGSADCGRGLRLRDARGSHRGAADWLRCQDAQLLRCVPVRPGGD